MKLRPLALAAFTGLSLAATSAQAASIAITNGDFETDVVATDSATSGTVDPVSWAYTGGANNLDLRFVVDGAFLNVATAGAAGVAGPHGGDQFFMAHVNSTNTAVSVSTINQDTSLLWSELSAGDTLTVSAWTTYRADVSGAAETYFWLNDIDGSGINSGSIDVTDAAQGVWTERVWNYEVTQADINASSAGSWGAVNVQLGIRGTTLHQVSFDDVSLVHTQVPEPSALALFGFGGLALLSRRRRR